MVQLLKYLWVILEFHIQCLNYLTVLLLFDLEKGAFNSGVGFGDTAHKVV
jgi:hypothetical protein